MSVRSKSVRSGDSEMPFKHSYAVKVREPLASMLGFACRPFYRAFPNPLFGERVLCTPGFVKGWFGRMYASSGFRSREHANVPLFRFSLGNIRMYPRSGFPRLFFAHPFFHFLPRPPRTSPGNFFSPKSPLSGTSDLLFLVEKR